MINLPNIDMQRTGRNITRLRKNAGLSVRDLQDMFGFSTPQAIYKWQHGTALPTVDNLVALSSILGVKVEDILAVYSDGEDVFFFRKKIILNFFVRFLNHKLNDRKNTQ